MQLILGHEVSFPLVESYASIGAIMLADTWCQADIHGVMLLIITKIACRWLQVDYCHQLSGPHIHTRLGALKWLVEQQHEVLVSAGISQILSELQKFFDKNKDFQLDIS